MHGDGTASHVLSDAIGEARPRLAVAGVVDLQPYRRDRGIDAARIACRFGYETELAHEVADGDARADLGTVLRVLGFDELGQAPGFRERDAQGALGVSAVVFALGLVALGARQDHYARGRVGRLGKRGGDFAPADLRLAVAGILHAVQEVVCRDVIDLDLEAVDGPLPTEKAGDLGPCHIEEPGIVLVADQLEYGPVPAGAVGESGAVGPAPGLLSRPCADGVLVPIRLPGFLYGRLEMGQLKRVERTDGLRDIFEPSRDGLEEHGLVDDGCPACDRRLRCPGGGHRVGG